MPCLNSTLINLNAYSQQSSAARRPRVLRPGSSPDALKQRLRGSAQMERGGGLQQGEWSHGPMACASGRGYTSTKQQSAPFRHSPMKYPEFNIWFQFFRN